MIKTISFSSLSDWNYCPYYYKLVNVEKLRKFTKNVYSYHGGLTHKYVQAVLKEEIDSEEAALNFEKIWFRFCRLFRKPLLEQLKKEEKMPNNWLVSSASAIRTIKEDCQKQFGDFKVIQTEERLALPYGSWPQKFKGFIDIVLATENNKLIIADFKNCDSDFMFNKYRDKYKDYQLTLYKHFYCLKHNIDPQNVETYFITLERNIKSKKVVHFIRVTSGPKKVQNALDWLSRVLASVNKGLWIKNRFACLKYGENHPCIFHKSKFCS